jgi:hypothetical protein
MKTYYVSSKYAIEANSPEPDSLEQLACVIAHSLPKCTENLKTLVAVDSNNPIVSAGILSDSFMCSVDLDHKSKSIWCEGLEPIRDSMANFRDVMDEAEFMLADACNKLDEDFANNKHWNSIMPSHNFNFNIDFDEVQSLYEEEFKDQVVKLFNYKEYKYMGF